MAKTRFQTEVKNELDDLARRLLNIKEDAPLSLLARIAIDGARDRIVHIAERRAATIAPKKKKFPQPARGDDPVSERFDREVDREVKNMKAYPEDKR